MRLTLWYQVIGAAGRGRVCYQRGYMSGHECNFLSETEACIEVLAGIIDQEDTFIF